LGKGTTNLEGRVKTTTAPFFQRDRLYIVGLCLYGTKPNAE
jgi:hypothetical protein